MLRTVYIGVSAGTGTGTDVGVGDGVYRCWLISVDDAYLWLLPR
jgi:hypothetical protein